ncbi:hypothetical protein I4U23_019308 [Adineta vaga]|nr:hypothetical protein I4U23_019308 [Adineta vaga]
MFNPSDSDVAAAVMYVNGSIQTENIIGLEYTVIDNNNSKTQFNCQIGCYEYQRS